MLAGSAAKQRSINSQRYGPEKCVVSARAGPEAGVDLVGLGGTKFGAKAYYLTSADMHTVGGSVFVKIPFYADAAPTDGGIKAVHK